MQDVVLEILELIVRRLRATQKLGVLAEEEIAPRLRLGRA